LVRASARGRKQLADRHVERRSELPQGSQSDRSTGLDPLIVPEREAAIHHVLLRQAALRAQPLSAAPKVPTETLEVSTGQDAPTLVS